MSRARNAAIAYMTLLRQRSGGASTPVNDVPPSHDYEGLSPNVGDLITGVAGTWSNADSIAHQWYRSGVAISGATSIDYTTVDADFGLTLTRVETAEPGGVTAESAATAAVSFVDDFERADGAIGNGWTGATWNIVGGAAVNTPGTTGAEKLTNAGFETWTNPTTPGTWGKTTAGTSSVNEESTIVHGGSRAARLDVDASASNVLVNQATAGEAHRFHRIEAWCYVSASGKIFTLGYAGGGLAGNSVSVDPGPVWTKYVLSGRSTGASAIPQFVRASAASSSGYIDDVSFKRIPETAIFAVRDFGVADPAVVRASWSHVRGNMSGVVVNLDDPANPLNFVIASHTGPVGNVSLSKYVNGVGTELINVTVGYVADALVEIRRTAGGDYQLWYNGTQRGADQTISDVGIISNTYHGLFSLYEGNSAKSFFAERP